MTEEDSEESSQEEKDEKDVMAKELPHSTQPRGVQVKSVIGQMNRGVYDCDSQWQEDIALTCILRTI